MGLPPKRSYSYLEFVVRNDNSVQLCFSNGHQSRQEATMHLVLEALKTIKYDLRKNRRVVFCTADRPPENAAHPVLAYSSVDGSENIIAAPDFSFWNWPDIGIADYTRLTEDMMAGGGNEPEDDRLFWIGNVATSKMRGRLMEIAARDKRIHAASITWVKSDRPEAWASCTLMKTKTSNYVSLPDHCRYRYLIDVEGVGYSGRLKLLFFSGRPVFLQDRPWREFYFDWLTPFEHFIPVERDLSDLPARLDWAEANPAECEKIARNAQAFARQHLTREAAIIRLRETISNLLS